MLLLAVVVVVAIGTAGLVGRQGDSETRDRWSLRCRQVALTLGIGGVIAGFASGVGSGDSRLKAVAILAIPIIILGAGWIMPWQTFRAWWAWGLVVALAIFCIVAGFSVGLMLVPALAALASSAALAEPRMRTQLAPSRAAQRPL